MATSKLGFEKARAHTVYAVSVSLEGTINSYHICAQAREANLDAELPGGRPAHDDRITSKFEDIASVHLHGVR